MNDTKKHHAAPNVHPREDGADAFIPDPAGGPAHIRDDFAQELAEEFIGAATSGEEHEDKGDEIP
ncbi:MAG: hypothetical protein ABIP39_13665 [Polyangiaceae bacterium]